MTLVVKTARKVLSLSPLSCTLKSIEVNSLEGYKCLEWHLFPSIQCEMAHIKITKALQTSLLQHKTI